MFRPVPFAPFVLIAGCAALLAVLRGTAGPGGTMATAALTSRRWAERRALTRAGRASSERVSNNCGTTLKRTARGQPRTS